MTARTKKQPNRVPPHNLEAEEAVLGCVMTTPDAADYVVTELDSDDFYSPFNRNVHAVIRELWRNGVQDFQPAIVADELHALGLADDNTTLRLMGMQAVPATPSSPHVYGRIVLEDATRRRLLGVLVEATELAFTGTDDVTALAEAVMAQVQDLRMPELETGDPSPNLTEWLEREFTHNWLVPGLLERRDRLIVTGGEGGGKSTLLTQLAICFAAGIHPFTFRPIDPVKVLVLDAENSDGQVQRALQRMAAIPAHIDPNMLLYETTSDLDLLTRHGSRWLYGRLAVNRPDVVIAGPLYKLHTGDPIEEASARRVAAVFDTARSRYDCAVILEAHAAKGGQDGNRSLAPYGASLWLRWPEFGYGLRLDREAEPREIDGHPHKVYFVPWRGARDQRDWPTKLNGDGAARWPWRDDRADDADF